MNGMEIVLYPNSLFSYLQMDVSLDGGVDKNRSYDRQTMAFHHVNHVAMSGSFVVTVEKVEGGVVGDMRMRVWRRKMDTNTFELLLSQVSKRISVGHG